MPSGLGVIIGEVWYPHACGLVNYDCWDSATSYAAPASDVHAQAITGDLRVLPWWDISGPEQVGAQLGVSGYAGSSGEAFRWPEGQISHYCSDVAPGAVAHDVSGSDSCLLS